MNKYTKIRILGIVLLIFGIYSIFSLFLPSYNLPPFDAQILKTEYVYKYTDTPQFNNIPYLDKIEYITSANADIITTQTIANPELYNLKFYRNIKIFSATSKDFPSCTKS